MLQLEMQQVFGLLGGQPVADAGPNQRVNSGSPVQLDGSRSTPVGQISFAWTPVTANAP